MNQTKFLIVGFQVVEEWWKMRLGYWRWRCFRKSLEVQLELAEKIVLVACCLHNMLCTDNIDISQNQELGMQNIRDTRINCTRVTQSSGTSVLKALVEI